MRQTGRLGRLLMQDDAEEALACVVGKVSAARAFHLKYYHRLLERGLPAEVEGEVHAQRLLVLYLCVVGCDLLRDEWLPAHGEGPTRDSGHHWRAAAIEEELRACYDPATGGFYPVPASAHTTTATLPMTHCALHVLMVSGRLRNAARGWLDVERTLNFVSLCQVGASQDRHGGFQVAPDVGESDVRFAYSAFMVYALLLLQAGTASLASSVVQTQIGDSVRAGLAHVMECWRPDEGGFAASPRNSGECHGGMTFCAVAAIAIGRSLRRSGEAARDLPAAFTRRVCRYIANRVSRGRDDADLFLRCDTIAGGCRGPIGYQGRPSKTCDTCYTHWLGCSLAMLRCAADGGGVVEPLPIAQFCVACMEGNDGTGSGDGLGIMGRSTDVEPDIIHATLGLSGLLCTLHQCVPQTSGFWGAFCAPHPVFGCSEASARLAGLPCMDSLLL